MPAHDRGQRKARSPLQEPSSPRCPSLAALTLRLHARRIWLTAAFRTNGTRWPALLILGLVLFLGTHAFTMAREPRAALVAGSGRGRTRLCYSLLSLAGLVLIAIGFGRYRAAGYIPVWDPPVWTRHLALLLVWPAFVARRAPICPAGSSAPLKHPMLAGVKIWAAAAPSRQRRSRLDPAVRLDPRLGRHGAHQREAPRRGAATTAARLPPGRADATTSWRSRSARPCGSSSALPACPADRRPGLARRRA